MPETTEYIMGEFFKPWRRKVCLLTLFMACVFIGGWVRSGFIRDTLNFKLGQYPVWLCSENGHVSWVAVIERDPKVWMSFYNWECDLPSGYSHFPSNYRLLSESLPITEQWKWIWLGFVTKLTGGEQTCWIISYWSIILPLTLLSAYLLLSKPRQLTQTKITEPITVEGA